MPKRNDDLLVADILEAAASIFNYIGDMDYDAFIAERKQ